MTDIAESLNKRLPIIISLFVFIIFFFPFLLGRGFYYGDYWTQHYPWAKALSEAIKAGTLPLWEFRIGCGFPLFAEGQMGALDPVKQILYRALDFESAYLLVFVAHFGIAFAFLYKSSRWLGMTSAGSLAVAISFVFGCAYAGMFYGLAALCVMSYSCGSFYFLLRFLRSNAYADICTYALFTGLSLLSGYPHLVIMHSIYVAIFVCIYPNVNFSGLLLKKVAVLLMATLIGFGIGMAQLLPTLELAQHSVRANLSAEASLSLSANPLSFLTLIYPGLGSLVRADMYQGLVVTAIILMSLPSLWANRRARVFMVMFLLFYCLALGKHNPIYATLVKQLNIGWVRNPGKFLIYCAFSLSFIIGFAIDSFAQEFLSKAKVWVRRLIIFCCVYVGTYACISFTFSWIRPTVKIYLQGYIESTLTQSTLPRPFSINHYLERVEPFLNLASERLSLLEPRFLAGIVILLLFIVVLALLRHDPKYNKPSWLLVAMLCLELWLYLPSGTGFMGNCIKRPDNRSNPIAQYLLQHRSVDSRIHTYARSAFNEVSGKPNSNILSDYSASGLSTPLVLSHYKEYMTGLGGIDDAMGYQYPDDTKLLSSLNRLRALSIQYIYTREDLPVNGEDLTLLASSREGEKLYTLSDPKPFAYIEDSTTHAVHPYDVRSVSSNALVLTARKWTKGSVSNGKFFVAQNFYPGWKARCDNVSQSVESSEDCGMSIPMTGYAPKVVYLYFDNTSFKTGLSISCIAMLVMFLGYFGLQGRRVK